MSTPLQKCMLAAIEKATLGGKKMTTAQAKKICLKKFPGGGVKFGNIGGKRANRNKR